MPGSKRTRTIIAGDLEAARLASTLGGQLASGRRAAGLTQGEVGERVGLRQSRISELELGRGATLPLGTWVALGLAIGRPLAVSFSRPLVDPGPIDAGHLDIQEGLVRLVRQRPGTVQVELATRRANPAHSVDVAVRDAARRYLLLEGWNRFGDLGDSIRSTDRKAAELRALADGDDVRVCWVIRATAANRELLRRYPAIIRSRFPGSSRAWVRALVDGTEPPREPGVVWWADGRPVAIRWPAGSGR